MKLEKITLGETGSFSSLFLDYLAQKEELKAFYNQFPTPDVFGKLIEERNFNSDKRQVLADELTRQYEGLTLDQSVQNNIESLRSDNTFTITTGHQLNIFTGPLYFIYKILTVINACNDLKKQYPDQNFVPVYWMASEDHDFEEINNFSLFGKKYTWESDQSGAVGRFNPNGLSKVLEELPEAIELFEKAYKEQNTLADAARYYVNELFGKYGVVVVDADCKALKNQFKEVIKEEIEVHKSNELAESTSSRLADLGYKSQIFSREINLFYLQEGSRERIVRKGDQYEVLNTGEELTSDKLDTLVEESPDCFSPNVVLRPLYQEKILPNLAYVGGPAEIAYWLQLKDIFDHYNTTFPALMPRNFAMVINKATQKKIVKNGLDTAMLFQDSHDIKAAYVDKMAESSFTLDDEKSELNSFFDKLKSKASEIDGSLEGYIGSENAKMLKTLDNIEKRLKKSEERKHETALGQIDGIKEKLFPGGGLQERKDNFLNFYLNNPNFIEELKDQFDPFDFRFHVLIDE